VDTWRTYQNVQIQEFIREQAIRNGKLNEEARAASLDAARAAVLIKSCTTPEGKCYQRQQEQTGDLLGLPEGPINTVVVTAIACADQPNTQTDREIIRCVETTLREARHE
jgi:hypothetical protein